MVFMLFRTLVFTLMVMPGWMLPTPTVKVIVHGFRFVSNLDLYALQVPVKYVSESDGNDKVGLFLPFCASF